MIFYVYTKALTLAGIVDVYKSAIWNNRYNTLGDCDLQLPATTENLQLLKIGYFLARTDDTMVCQIRKIEIDTSTESGNYLIVTGKDVKGLLDQRIVWGIEVYNTTYENMIRTMITNSCITPTNNNRRFWTGYSNILALGADAGFTDTVKEQISYKNVGEKIREICAMKHWGYRVVMNSVRDGLLFELYAGVDRSGSVVFSPQFDNLKQSKFTTDCTNMGNSALIGGQGEGTERIMTDVGDTQYIERHELFVDAKDIPNKITWEQLTSAYPTGSGGNTGYISNQGTNYFYRMHNITFPIFSQTQEAALIDEYPSGVFNQAHTTYTVTDAIIADLPNNNPQASDSVTMRDSLYDIYLINRGLMKIAEYGEKVSFDGTIIPDVTYKYRTDYNLGDIVTVEDEYGNSKSVRITEALEVDDVNGYRIEIKFENLIKEAEA